MLSPKRTACKAGEEMFCWESRIIIEWIIKRYFSLFYIPQLQALCSVHRAHRDTAIYSNTVAYLVKMFRHGSQSVVVQVLFVWHSCRDGWPHSIFTQYSQYTHLLNYGTLSVISLIHTKKTLDLFPSVSNTYNSLLDGYNKLNVLFIDSGWRALLSFKYSGDPSGP